MVHINEHLPAHLGPSNTKCFGLCLVDGCHVTLHHEAQDIHINISINIALEYDFLSLGGNLIKHKFDLFALSAHE